MVLKDDYKYPKWLGKKKYAMTYNQDNTVSFTDVTTYIDPGDYITADDINATNQEVMRIYENYQGWINYPYDLKTDYANSTFDGRKKFRMVDNGDNTVSFEDETVYTQEGDEISSFDFNTTNKTINEIDAAYDESIQLIYDKLTELGVDNPYDIIGSINQLGKISNDRGKEAGRQNVLDNPHLYNLYTQAQYDVYANRAASLKSAIRTAKSRLETDISNISKNGGTIINTIDDKALEYERQITVGMSKSASDAKINEALNYLRTTARTSIINYKNTYVNEATSVKNYLEQA